jgi:hypothetical protein
MSHVGRLGVPVPNKVQVLNPDVYGVTALIPVQRQSVNSSRPEFLPDDASRQSIRQRSRPMTSSRERFAVDQRLHFLSAKLDVS